MDEKPAVPGLGPLAAGVLDTADATVISSLHRRHRATEFRKFRTEIDRQVPEGQQILNSLARLPQRTIGA